MNLTGYTVRSIKGKHKGKENVLNEYTKEKNLQDVIRGTVAF